MKLWTILSDYTATGEGRTICACIVYATDYTDAEIKFGDLTNPYWIDAIILCEEGIPLNNKSLNFLFSRSLLENIKHQEGKCNVSLCNTYHYNYS